MKTEFTPKRFAFVLAIVLCFVLIFINPFEFVTKAEQQAAAILAPSITATNNDALVVDNDSDGIADPGDTIEYTVTVNNGAAVGAGNDATAMVFSDTLDNNMTLVPGSVQSSPIAGNDTYNVLGNVSISVPDGANDLLGNDIDPDTGNNTGLTAAGGVLSSQGGNITINSNGSFTYNPPPGFEGTDSFVYSVLDGNGNVGMGTVTLNVSGMIWFVNNNATACTTLAAGCGRLSNPFSTLAAFVALNNNAGNNPGNNDNIFVFESATAYTGITILTGQKLIGQDATAALDTIAGVTVPSFSTALPAMNTGGNATTFSGGAGTGVATLNNNTLRGFTIGNSIPALSGTNFGTLTLNDVIINSNNAAMVLNNGTANAAFTSVTSTGGNVNINLTSVAGTVNLGTGALSGAISNNLFIDQGTATVSYSGTITAGNNTRPVSVTNKTGGSVSLSGLISTQAATTSNGINLNSNSGGGTITFSGGVQLSTGTNPAFTATSSGTVVATQNNTSIVNTLTSTTGTALNIANTTIGASGVTFRSISVNGAANGIILNSTGASGGLTVTGTGTTDGTGGTIQNTTTRGASITSASGISLNNMNFTNAATTQSATNCANLSLGGNSNLGCNAPIHLDTVNGATLENLNINGSAQQGINGRSVTNFVLNNTVITAIGNAADEDGIHFLNMLGTCSITNTSVSGSFDDNLIVQNLSGTSTLTISGSTFSNSTAGSGILFGIRGGVAAGSGANSTINITGSTQSTNNFSGGIVADAFDGSTMALNVTNSTSSGNNDQLSVSAGDNSNVDLNATSNTLSSVTAGPSGVGDFVVVSLEGSAFDNGFTFDARIQNNNITSANNVLADGVFVFNAGGGIMNVLINGNTIDYGGSQNAINIQPGQDGAGTTNATVTGNNIDVKLDGTSNAQRAMMIQVAVASPSGDNSFLCADIGGGTAALRNTVTHSLGGTLGAGGDLRLRQRFVTTVRLPGYGGANNDNAAVVTYVSGRNTFANSPGMSATNEVGVTPGAGGFVGGAACTQPSPFAPLTKQSLFNSNRNSDDDLSLFNTSYQSPSEMLASIKPFGNHSDIPQTILSKNAEQTEIRTAAIEETEINAVVTNESAEVGYLTKVSEFFAEVSDKLIETISPTVKAQSKKDIPVNISGETITVGAPSGFTLPASKSFTIKFRATINAQPPVFTQVSNQGTVSGSNFANVLTDDPTVGGAANPTVTLVDSTTVAVTSSQNPSIVGQTVTFTATLTGAPVHASGNPTGTVEFFDGATSLGTAPAVAGAVNTATATINVSTLTSGNHTITANYSGGGQFNANSGSLTGNPQVVSNTAVWDGSASANWDTAANWATNAAPFAGNDVSIPSAGVTNNPTISATDITVNSLNEASGRLLTINSGRTLNVTGACVINGTLNVAGAFNCGSFAGTGTVNFVGTAAQNLPALTYNNLTINNASGVNLAGNATVNGTLTLVNGNINTGGNILTIGTTGSITRTAGHIIGDIEKFFASTGTFTYPTGTATGYSPVFVNVSVLSVNPSSLKVKANSGIAPATPPLNNTMTLNRYWTLTETGDLTANVTFNYLQADVNGTESNYRTIRIESMNATGLPNGSPCPGAGNPCVDTTANTIFVGGVSQFSDWTAGDFAPVAANASISGQVSTNSGRGLSKAVVVITGGNLTEPRYTTTNEFGYYRFNDLQVGETYVVTVKTKRFGGREQTSLVSLNEDISELNFTFGFNDK